MYKNSAVSKRYIFPNLSDVAQMEEGRFADFFHCLSIERNSSNETPMLFAACEACITSRPTAIDSNGGRGQWQALSTRSSVLSLFSINLFNVIQLVISLMHD